MSNVHVLLVYGGQSSEHDVSLASARNVFAALDNTRYDITTCLIDRDGRWWLQDTIGDYHSGNPQLLPVLGQRRFVTLPHHRIIQPDVILPILHGKNGEDGTVQGLFELLGLPYVGPHVAGAAISMDKDLTKRLLRSVSIPVVDDLVWRTSNSKPLYDQVVKKLGKSLFVKPANGGSSIGVSKVNDLTQYDKALDLASSYDSTILIEKAIIGNEYQISLLGNKDPDHTEIGEIIVGADFHDYEDKYNPATTAKMNIPARINLELSEQIEKYAQLAYGTTRCFGLARIDFFIDEKEQIYLNEINAIPGFTSVSVYPKLWKHQGLSYPHLIARLIDLALE